MKTTVVFIAGVLASFIVFSLQKSAAATANPVVDFSASSQSSFCGDSRSVVRPSLELHPSPRTASTAATAGSSVAVISQSSIVNRQSAIENFPFPSELPTIAEAAMANGITTPDHYAVLLAIRCAENGRDGRQFGVLHPRAIDTDLRTQAGWAAATVAKTWTRTLNAHGGKEVSPATEAFIDILAARYCPPSVDPVGHENWKKNVKFYYQKFSTQEPQNQELKNAITQE